MKGKGKGKGVDHPARQACAEAQARTFASDPAMRARLKERIEKPEAAKGLGKGCTPMTTTADDPAAARPVHPGEAYTAITQALYEVGGEYRRNL